MCRWDRTAQTCSLASLILDPYYRTLDGFQCLIEKEWLSFGHKFTDRCGHIQIGDSKEIAPVFTQFIDAVWQITQQFPSEFEFNENYLFTIHDHVYSCQFGNFIGNCEREREAIDVQHTTYSLWAKLDAQKEEYANPLYALSGEPKQSFLQVQLLPQLVRFWRSMYNRFDFGIHPRECLTDLLTVTYNHTISLEGHINYLKHKIEQIQQLKDKQHKLNLVETNLAETKQSLLTKQNSIESQSIKSFDSINSSLKIVEEVMQRLQMKHNLSKQSNESTDSSEDRLDERGSERAASRTSDKQPTNDSCVDINLIELINCMQSVALDWQSVRRGASKCVCGNSFEQTNNRTSSNCYSCGLMYCNRCIEKRVKLPGHLFGAESKSGDSRKESTSESQARTNDVDAKLDRADNNEPIINKPTIDQANNEKNEQLNNRYKVHPLEQLDQQADSKQAGSKPVDKQLIENRLQQVERTGKSGRNMRHPLEVLATVDNDEEEEDEDEGFEPLEVAVECEEIAEHDDAAGLANGTGQASRSLLYEYVPVCLSCYRQMVKVN